MTQIRRRQRQGFLFAESLRQIMADRILRPGIAQGVRGKLPLQPHLNDLFVPALQRHFEIRLVDQPAIVSIRDQ